MADPEYRNELIRRTNRPDWSDDGCRRTRPCSGVPQRVPLRELAVQPREGKPIEPGGDRGAVTWCCSVAARSPTRGGSRPRSCSDLPSWPPGSSKAPGRGSASSEPAPNGRPCRSLSTGRRICLSTAKARRSAGVASSSRGCGAAAAPSPQRWRCRLSCPSGTCPVPHHTDVPGPCRPSASSASSSARLLARSFFPGSYIQQPLKHPRRRGFHTDFDIATNTPTTPQLIPTLMGAAVTIVGPATIPTWPAPRPAGP